jgi:opacity protein-like surface antigen
MKRTLALLLFMGLSVLPAFSQVDEVPRFEVMGGFSHVTGDLGLNGWEAAGTYRASPWLGIVADISGQYGSDEVLGVDFKSNLHNFLFGPRVYVPLQDYPRWQPFGHLLLGVSRVRNEIDNPLLALDETDSAFSWALGGGIDYQLAPQFRARVQLELLRTNFFDTGDSRARFGVGLVYQFGE